MHDPELITLDLNSPPQRVRVDVPSDEDFRPWMHAAMKCYCASMREKPFERAPMGWHALVRGFFAAQGTDRRVFQDEPCPAFTKWDGDRVMVCLTGGKDSVLMLLEMIEARGADNVIGFYVDGLNRSEASYERAAVSAICEKHGVRYAIARAQVSGAKNRTGHQIGLRDQLVLTMAMMYARYFEANSFAMGIHFDEHDETAPTWSESATAIGLWSELTGFTVHTLPIDELAIINRMIEHHMDTLEMTVSCYTQRNFRESQHARMVKKFPDSWVHPNGCGICNKCLRIQGAVALHRGDTAMLDYVMTRHEKDFPDEPTLRLIRDQIQSAA